MRRVLLARLLAILMSAPFPTFAHAGSQGAVLEAENAGRAARAEAAARAAAAARAREEATARRRDAAAAAAAKERREVAERADRNRREATERADLERRGTEERRVEADSYNQLDQAAAQLAAGLTAETSYEVVKVTPPRVLVRGGSDAGLKPSDDLRCFHRGESLGADLGFEETPVGEARVDTVRERVSYLLFDGEGAELLKVGDVCYPKNARTSDFGRIAILPMLYRGRPTRLGESIADRLYQAASSRGLKVVERGQLTRILAEQRLGGSALLDSHKAAKMGELSGAQTLFMGTIDDAGGFVVVTARLVHSRDGVLVASREIKLPKNDYILPLLAEPAADGDVTIAKADNAAEQLALDNPEAEADRAVDKAETLYRQGSVSEAEEAFKEAVAKDPDAPRVKAFARRLKNAAESEAQTLAKKELERADTLLRAGDAVAAEQAFRKAAELDPDGSGVKAFARRVKNAPVVEAKRDLDRADSMLRSGNLNGAAEAFQRAMLASPESPEIKAFAEKLKSAPAAEARVAAEKDLDRADALLRAGDEKGADDAFRRAMLLDPESPGVRALARRLKRAPSDESEAAGRQEIARADTRLRAGDVAGAT
ncbi:MAG: hypothetical protein RLZZ403_1945, partial [Pseudomonadota bacterium]